MAPPHSLTRVSSTSSQHTIHAPSLALSTENPNVFSDENALEPSALTPDSTSSPSEGNPTLPTSSNASQPPASQRRRQSSLIEDQSHKRRSIRDDELLVGLRREASSTRNPNHHADAGSLLEMSKGSTSDTSAFAMPRTQSPYQGATGPSHPYGMYPQDIGISRTPSSATIPTARAPERIRSGVGGPTQPYGMYPQNTVPEDDTTLGAEIFQPMPGFPGRQRNYQRRFGPDSDEVADIVGPDGYTEQLPAYTRYANDIPPKATNSTSGTRRGEPYNEPGESRDTLNTITSEDSDLRSPAVVDSSIRLSAPVAGVITSHSGVNASPLNVDPSLSACIATASGGGHFKELVKERGKKRVCFGKLPMWLCMVFLVVGACVIGGMIGGILGRAKASSEAARSPFIPATFSLPTVTATVTATSLVDAEPISSPWASIPTPILGDYTILLKNANNVSKECVPDPLKAPAWDCTAGALMALSIQIEGSDSDPVVLFNYSDNDGPSDSTLSKVRYGAQPPILNNYTNMSLMQAKEHRDKGPAYVFHKQFDKLVILPEDTFDDVKSRRQRRDSVYDGNYHFSEALYAPPGHKPWFCYWNGTLLEGFIFVIQEIATHDTVEKRADYDGHEEGTSTVSTSPTPPTYPLDSWSPVDPLSSPSRTTEVSEGLASFITFPPSPLKSFKLPPLELGSASAASASEISLTMTPDLAADETVAAADELPSDDTASEAPASYNSYPLVMKIEELRDLENQIGPYCQQMLIMEDKSVQIIDYQRIDLSVEEFRDIQSRRSKKRGESSKKRSNVGKRGNDYGCACEWIVDGS